MRCFTDGARDDDVAAMGWRIEHTDGVEEGNRYIVGSHSSMEAEYYALLDGLRYSKRFGDEVIVFTDCEPLVRKMRHDMNGDDEWNDRQQGCRRLLDKFEWWQLEWIPRGQNEAANTQATMALRQGREYYSK